MRAKNNLRHYREQAGLTQKQVAQALSLSKSGYCLKENGKRGITIEQALEISRILGVPITKIF